MAGLDFDRGAVFELAVEALVVPPPDPLERRELDLLDRAPGPATTDQLGLVEPVDRLGESIVIRIADGLSRWLRAELDDPIGVDDREVVGAVIGVVDYPGQVAAGAPRGPRVRISRAVWSWPISLPCRFMSACILRTP